MSSEVNFWALTIQNEMNIRSATTLLMTPLYRVIALSGRVKYDVQRMQLQPTPNLTMHNKLIISSQKAHLILCLSIQCTLRQDIQIAFGQVFLSLRLSKLLPQDLRTLLRGSASLEIYIFTATHTEISHHIVIFPLLAGLDFGACVSVAYCSLYLSACSFILNSLMHREHPYICRPSILLQFSNN